jgi:hypothetical protein
MRLLRYDFMRLNTIKDYKSFLKFTERTEVRAEVQEILKRLK